MEEAIKEFNNIFKSDCKLLDITNEEIKILFKGHICFTCGAYDYFEDLATKISEKLGKEYGIAKYEQRDDGSYVVHFKPKEKINEVKRDIKIFLYI